MIVANTIVRDNQNELTGPTQTRFCNIKGSFPGIGNIDADPLFVGLYDHDYHISYDSPCKDAGNNSFSIDAGLTQDFEGDRRIADSNVDIGADEFFPHIYRNKQAIVPRGEAIVAVIGYPGAAPVTLGFGSGMLTTPHPTPYGPLFLDRPISTYHIGTIPSNGVLLYTTLLPASWVPGEEYPLQVFWGSFGVPGSLFSNPLLLRVGGKTITVRDDYGTIQEAINASVDGDEIVVKPGKFDGGINFYGKAITLRSERGARKTVISRGNSVVTFCLGEKRDTIIQGFCIVLGEADEGGGLYCIGASPTVRQNIISRNTGGDYLGFDGHGGGICCRLFSSPLLDSNIITANTAEGWSYWNEPGFGGGVFLGFHCDAVLVNNIIKYNMAGDTGGPSSPGYGGGLYCRYASPIVTNNTIVANISNHGGSAIYAIGTEGPVVTNCIIRENGVVGPMTVNYSNLHSTFPGGIGNIYTEPEFVQRDRHDFHLTYDSACRNAGDNNALGLQDVDYEEDSRIYDGQVDMGADEFAPHLYYWIDIDSGPTLRVAGRPDMTPVTLIQGSGVRDEPVATPYGDLYLLYPAVRKIDLGTIPSSGVLITPVTAPGPFQPWVEYPFQALIGDTTNPDSTFTNLLLWFCVP